MRYKGKLKNWKDDKGFGFIEPALGGDDVFVHITSFQNRSRRPEIGDLMTYELRMDKNGKQQAAYVAYSREAIRPVANYSASTKGLLIAISVAIAFLLLTIFLGVLGRFPEILVWLYLGTSTLAFFMYAMDKSAARKGRWRTKESSLLFCGLVGGWPGALIAQQLFRHKSAKVEFLISFWITVMVNIGFFGWTLTPSGSSEMTTLLLQFANNSRL